MQNRGTSTGCNEQEICLHGHCLEEPSMVMIKCLWTPVNFSTVFKFFMDSVPIYGLHSEWTLFSLPLLFFFFFAMGTKVPLGTLGR